MFELYNYQKNAVDMLREKMRIHKRVCLCIPTGGGKTIIFSHIANTAIEKGKKVLICVHRDELKEQASKTSKATVVMVETLNNRIKSGKININDYDLVIVDEIHIGNFRKVLTNYNGFVIGATATPVTIKKDAPLKDLLNDIIIPVDIPQLIEIKRLAKPRTFARVPLNFNKLKKIGGEYSEKSLNEVFNNRQVYDGLIEDYKTNLSGKKGIIFCSSIAHTENVYNLLIEDGINAFCVHSKMKDRKSVVDKFMDSTDGVIVNCGILTTGFDCPDIDFVMVNRATTSLSLWLQMVGRGSRVINNVKDSFLIYDYGMNCHNLGMWEDYRNWHDIFFRDPKKKSEGVAPIKTCPNCHAVFNSSVNICQYCGHEFEKKEKIDVKTELIELTLKESNNKYIYNLSPNQIIEVSKKKGYKQTFLERALFHIHGESAVNSFWDSKSYKNGYRYRRIEKFKTETPIKNFKIKL